MKKTDVFKILSDPTRLSILEALFDSGKELCVSEISEITKTSQSATSHQLKKLELRGIVSCFRDGQMMCYELQDNDLTKNLKKLLTY